MADGYGVPGAVERFVEELAQIRHTSVVQGLAQNRPIDQVLDDLDLRLRNLVRRVLQSVGPAAILSEDLPEESLDHHFQWLNQQPAGLLPSILQRYNEFAEGIADVISAVRSLPDEALGPLVDRLEEIRPSFLSTRDSLRTFLLTHHVTSHCQTAAHALMDGQLQLMNSSDHSDLWRTRLARSEVGSFVSTIQSYIDFSREVLSVAGANPIAIVTSYQFNSLGPHPASGTMFECMIQGDNSVVAHVPGHPEDSIGTCPGTLPWTQHLVQVLQHPDYSIYGFWCENYSIYQNQAPTGQRFKVTLVCYVSDAVELARSTFNHFRQNFTLGNSDRILPWDS